MIAWPAKDPADIADFTWTPALDHGDHIATFVATVMSGTVTQSTAATHSNTVGTVWLLGGVDSELARLTLTITTTGGRTFREGAVVPVFARASESLAIFRLKYPELAAIPDGTISYRLYEAQTLAVGWPAEQQLQSRTAWAAHKVSEIGDMPAGVTSFKSGTFSASISDAAAARTGFDATVYGREYLGYVRLNYAGPRPAFPV